MLVRQLVDHHADLGDLGLGADFQLLLFEEARLEGILNEFAAPDAVDVRGDGGYLVTPPSIHNSGKRYEWERAPGSVSVAQAPGRRRE